MISETSHRSRRRFLKGGVSLLIVASLSGTNRPTAAIAAGIPAGGDVGQREWRFCNKCFGLFYDGYAQDGRCPAGGAHFAQGINFELPFNTAAALDTQKDWRFCNKCSSMFYDGFSPKGLCPAGSGHVAQGYNFVLHHDTPASLTAQPNWRFCNKCFVMFYDGYPQKGVCPAGGGHVAQGHNFVLSHARVGGSQDSHGFPSTPGFKYCAVDCSVCRTNGLQCNSVDFHCNPVAGPVGCY